MDYTKRTSASDLYTLADKLGIKSIIICRKSNLKNYINNKKISNYIVNLDDVGMGSHWVALNSSKKIYFDSYAQPPPEIIKNYKLASNIKQVQSLESSDCGGLSVLWLYYINFKSNSEYYKLFKDTYK